MCGIFLDNFTQGKKMGSMFIRYGASDLGGTLYDENVPGCAENKIRSTVDELVHMIKSAGFIPAQRNTCYEILRRL